MSLSSSREKVQALLNPKNVVIVGASAMFAEMKDGAATLSF